MDVETALLPSWGKGSVILMFWEDTRRPEGEAGSTPMEGRHLTLACFIVDDQQTEHPINERLWATERADPACRLPFFLGAAGDYKSG